MAGNKAVSPLPDPPKWNRQHPPMLPVTLAPVLSPSQRCPVVVTMSSHGG